MFPYLTPIRRLFSNGTKTKKYLHPIKLPLALFNRVKKTKESLKGPLSFLGVVSFILFISLSFASFLKPLPEKETPSFLRHPPKILSQSFSQNPFLNPVNKLLIESPDFLLIEKNALRAATPPSLISPRVLGALIAGYEPKDTKKEITEYIVRSGDTLLSLSDQFEISLKTILWANDLTEKSIIKPGDKLIILPVSGVIYYVKSGDTLSEIAKTYKGKIDEIMAFNDLSNENDIYIGDILIIPNGVMPPPAAKLRSVPFSVPLVDSQFILPVSSPYIITQVTRWDNAVDFSHPGYACGKPVFAVAGGTIQKISYNRFYGDYVRILHPNNVVTLYAHLSGITVKTGDKVNIGDIIGYIGNTGRTIGPTGCHLHFEVRGARNPFIR